MPSVSEGRVLTGLFCRKVAVEELLRSETGALGLLGALNWKNSYSAVRNQTVSKLRATPVQGPTSSHGPQSFRMQSPHDRLQDPSRTDADGLHGVGIKKADEKERHVVLPGNSPEAAEVWHGNEVMVAVFRIADLQLAEVRPVVHVPAEDHGAESKAFLRDAEELLLGDQLAPQLTVHVDAGELDLGVLG